MTTEWKKDQKFIQQKKKNDFHPNLQIVDVGTNIISLSNEITDILDMPNLSPIWEQVMNRYPKKAKKRQKKQDMNDHYEGRTRDLGVISTTL